MCPCKSNVMTLANGPLQEKGRLLSLHHVYSLSQLDIALCYTKLYSFRFSCKIVSLTAAKTNRMFSVSVEKEKKYSEHHVYYKFPTNYQLSHS